MNTILRVFGICLFLAVIYSKQTLGQLQVSNVIKPGDCPPPTQVEVCHRACTLDGQCAGIGKCCPTSCGGRVCTHPVTQVKQIVKPGECPEPGGPWVCTSKCSGDANCAKNLKCCPNRCNVMSCQKPDGLDPPAGS